MDNTVSILGTFYRDWFRAQQKTLNVNSIVIWKQFGLKFKNEGF